MDGWSGVAQAALGIVDKALAMGLIKMKEKWTKKYYDTKKALEMEYKKLKPERDYRLIKDLEDELILLMDNFEQQVEEGRS